MFRRVLVLIVLGTLLTVFTFSCIDDCVCGPPGTFRITIQGHDLVAYQTQGLGLKPVIDSAFSIAFGIQINFKQLSERIALQENTKAHFFGNSAYACDCVGPRYETPDPVKDANLYLIDPLQEDTVLVTDKFRVFFGESSITLDSAVRYINFYSGYSYQNGSSGLMLELVEPSLFIGRKQIKCITSLQSGKSFTTVTPNIFFK